MPLYTSPDDRRSDLSKIFTTQILVVMNAVHSRQKPVPALASLCAQSLASLLLFDSPLHCAKVVASSHASLQRVFQELLL
jgi:hypothetical protein